MENLGRKGKDQITGFEGTITSVHNYLTGCTQYGLQPCIKKDGSLGDIMYFDKTRIKITGNAVELDKQSIEEDTGCDYREHP